MNQPQTVETDFGDEDKDELESGHALMQGQYTIDAFLNAGGFGITYLARNSLGRKVVIKECFPGSLCRRTATSVQARSRAYTGSYAAIVSKFVDEAHSLAKLKHPNVVGVHQVFEENKTAYMVLDYIEGQDLLALINGETDLPGASQIETILGKLLDAIAHIHNQGMLHRDISPDNILLQSDMEPVLIDFGAARQEDVTEDRVLSEMRVVKDGYSPQEFYVSGAEQGPSSDLYALAATFHHVITGELPVNSQTRLAAVAAGEPDPYVALAGRVPGYSDPFLRGIDQALNILPKDRIGSAALWLDILDGTSAVGQPDDSRAMIPKPAPAPVNKGKARMLAGIGLALPIIGGAVFLQVNGSPTAPEQTAALPLAAEATQSVAVAAQPDPGRSEDATAETDIGGVLNLAALALDAQTDAGSSTPGATGSDLSAVLNLGATAPGATVTPAQSGPPENSVVAPVTDPEQGTDAANALGLNPVPVTEPVAETPAVDNMPFLKLLATTGKDDVAQSVPVSAPLIKATPPANPLAIESFDLPQVASAWSVDLTGVQSILAGAVYLIDGVPMESDAQIDTVLHQMLEAPQAATLELSVLAGDADDAVVVETVNVPVIHRTSMDNGTVFETRMVDGNWTTVVVDAPAGSELAVNDVVVGDVSMGVAFDKRTSLPEALVHASDQDLDWLTLAVRREGTTSVVSMSVPG